MTTASMELPPEGMLLGGVALAGDEAHGSAVTTGLSLLFTSAGITVQGPTEGSERLLAWTGLDGVACNEKTTMADGSAAAVLELKASGQSVRFLLPATSVSPGQAAYLDQAMPQWLNRYGSQPGAAGAPEGPAPEAPGVAPTFAGPAAGAPAAEPIAAEPIAAPPIYDPLAGPPPGAEPAKKPRFGRSKKEAAPTAAALDLMGGLPPAAPAAEEVAPGGPAVAGTEGAGFFGAPGDLSAPMAGAGPAPAAKGGRRNLYILVGILVLLLAGGGVYLGTKGGTSSTTTTISTLPSGGDSAIAKAVSLASSDLPAGWSTAPSSSPNIAASSTYTTAVMSTLPNFAGCLGVPASSITNWFGTTSQPDVTATSTSPLFAETAQPTTTVQSTTTIVKTAADATADSAAFSRPNFLTCYTEFQQAVFQSAVPGSLASVTEVHLNAPTGGASWAAVVTVSGPGSAVDYYGFAYVLAGRIEATVRPFAQGPSTFPAPALNSIYSNFIGKVDANATK